MDISEDKIKLYVKIARKFAIDLPNEKERIKAIKWIQKISSTDDPEAKQTKFHALHLLLLCLQKKVLVGPFMATPKKDKTLKEHTWGYQPNDIGKFILASQFEKTGKPPLTVEISGDLSEFLSFQEIPNFGAQFYYAFSPEEIRNWDNLNKHMIPRGLLNVTLLSEPDASVLAEQIAKNFEHRSTSPFKPRQVQERRKEFGDASILDENAAQVKKGFVSRLPHRAAKATETAAKTETLKKASRARIVKPSDIALDPTMRKEVEATQQGPHIETVAVKKDGKKVATKRRIKKPKKRENTEEEKLAEKVKEMEEQREKEKLEQIAKLPPSLRERLQKKYTATEEEKEMRTPEICKARSPHSKIRGLKIRPAEGDSSVEKIGSPLRRMLGKQASETTPVTERRMSDKIKLSWERGKEAMEKSRKECAKSSDTPRRRGILERLDRIKRAQSKRIVMEGIKTPDITPEEVQFEKFVRKELPEEKERLDTLGAEETQFDDVFGDRINRINVLEQEPLGEALEKAEVLLETEMETNDLFLYNEILDPKMAFKEVVVEGERLISSEGELHPKRSLVRVGRRELNLPGVEPAGQIFIEEVGEPSITGSILNKVLDNKLASLKPGDSAPRTYGPWANKFLKEIERFEKGETDKEEIIDLDTVDFDDIFSEDIPELAQEERMKKSQYFSQAVTNKSSKNFESFKKKYETYKQKQAEKDKTFSEPICVERYLPQRIPEQLDEEEVAQDPSFAERRILDLPVETSPLTKQVGEVSVLYKEHDKFSEPGLSRTFNAENFPDEKVARIIKSRLRKIREKKKKRKELMEKFRRIPTLEEAPEESPEIRKLERESYDKFRTHQLLRQSVAGSRKLKELKKRIGRDEEEVAEKDPVQEMEERLKVIKNMDLMGENEEVNEVLNPIEQYEKDLDELDRSRRIQKLEEEKREEAYKVIQRIEENAAEQAAIAQRDREALIRELDYLDWSIEEPMPKSQFPFPHLPFAAPPVRLSSEEENIENISPLDMAFVEQQKKKKRQRQKQLEQEQQQQLECEKRQRQERIATLNAEVKELERNRMKHLKDRKVLLNQIVDEVLKRDAVLNSIQKEPETDSESNNDYYIVQDLDAEEGAVGGIGLTGESAPDLIQFEDELPEKSLQYVTPLLVDVAPVTEQASEQFDTPLSHFEASEQFNNPKSILSKKKSTENRPKRKVSFSDHNQLASYIIGSEPSQILYDEEPGAESRIHIVKTFEPGKETMATIAEHTRIAGPGIGQIYTLPGQSRVISPSQEPLRSPAHNMPKKRVHFQQSQSPQSRVISPKQPSIDHVKTTKTLTLSTKGRNKNLLKKASLVTEQESESNVRRITQQNIATSRDRDITKTSIAKRSLKKGPGVGRPSI